MPYPVNFSVKIHSSVKSRKYAFIVIPEKAVIQ